MESSLGRPAHAFGLTLRRLRIAKRISQEQLAHNSGMDRTYISLLERGLRQPSLSTMLGLSRALEVAFSELAKDIERELEEMAWESHGRSGGGKL